MKNIKNYNNFLKENIKDILQPKSKDDIINNLKNINSNNIKYIFNYIIDNNISKKYLPSKDILIDKIVKSNIGGGSLRYYKNNGLLTSNDIYEIFKKFNPKNQVKEYLNFIGGGTNAYNNLLKKLLLDEENQKLREYLGPEKSTLILSGDKGKISKKPRGYMTYRILKLVSEHPEGIRRKDLIKMIFNINYGKTLKSYDPSKHSVYYGDFFASTELLSKTGIRNTARWYINSKGLDKLKFYEEKFKDIDDKDF